MTQNQPILTVRDLIKQLLDFDPNTEVQIYEDNMFAGSSIPKLVYSAPTTPDEKPLLYIEAND